MSGGFYPSVALGDGQWDFVVRALRLTGTKRDDALAGRIAAQLRQQRERRDLRERLYISDSPVAS